ncbi:hypothetical protein P3T39_005072 [Kitasatospora sp. GP82]|nr:hypothetical protein [Kitasatospora sp. GP82]
MEDLPPAMKGEVMWGELIGLGIFTLVVGWAMSFEYVSARLALRRIRKHRRALFPGSEPPRRRRKWRRRGQPR